MAHDLTLLMFVRSAPRPEALEVLEKEKRRPGCSGPSGLHGEGRLSSWNQHLGFLVVGAPRAGLGESGRKLDAGMTNWGPSPRSGVPLSAPAIRGATADPPFL